MPTATSTFSLNISAIQALCRGSQILSSTTSPLASVGSVDDFYINSTSYILYGPKSSTTFWATSTSLIGPSGTNGINGSLSADASLSSCYIGNTLKTGLIVSSVGYSSALFSSDQQAVMSVYSAGSAVLLANRITSVFSASALQLGNVVTFTGPINNSTNTFNTSGRYVLIGAGDLYAGNTFAVIAASTTLSGFTTILNSGQTAVASNLSVSTNVSGSYAGLATYNTATSSKTMFNFPLSTVLSTIATTPATVTINGSISSNGLISKGIAVVNSGNLTLSSVPNYIYTGSTSVTWTMPRLSTSIGTAINIKNRGSGTVTLTASPGTTDLFWLTGATTSLLANSGSNYIGSYMLVGDGTYWNAI